MSMGPCGPLRVPEWLWRTLGEQGQDPTARPAQKNTESLSDFTCVTHELVRMSGYTCPCPHVCVHLMCPSSVCISCPCVFGNRHSSACACISVHTPGPEFTSVLVHLDQPLFPCASNVLVHPWLCTRTPVLVRVMWTEHLHRSWQPFSGKAKRSNNFGFAGHVVSVTTTQLSHCSEKAATDKK